MVLEIKYVNAVIHTENSKLLLDLNCSPKELEKTVVNWELGFGPNLGWELGFGTPLHDPHLYLSRNSQSHFPMIHTDCAYMFTSYIWLALWY